MIRISQDEIQKWRIEIDNAEEFRKEQFGCDDEAHQTLAGENIGYYETGMSPRLMQQHNIIDPQVSFNIVAPIVDNVVPTLTPKEPYVVLTPKRRGPDEDSAPIAGEILNYRYKDLNLKNINSHVIFDGYILGYGVSKIGYTTKFGTMPTEKTIKEEKKDREKSKLQKIKEQLGLSKPKKEDVVENPELDEFIKSESPYVKYVDPFRFGIDPRATSIYNANYVYEIIPKRLSDVKKDKTYANTAELEGEVVDEDTEKRIPATQIDDFRIINLVELHYKTDEGINILVLALDGEKTKALKHDENVLEIDGFQYELLDFNKHAHKLYPVSDITKIKGIQDRIQETLDAILDQVDKYVPKLFVNETALTEEGERALENGGIGAIVKCNTDPNTVVREGSFTQLKGDLLALIDRVLDIAMLMTGLTKAQLVGLTSAQTATEAQIGQAGQNLRLADKGDKVTDFLNRQARKLWQVEKQFTDFEEIDLITGEQSIDPNTGLPVYSWLPDIDSDMSDKLAKGEYRFSIEVGNTEKAELPVLRKQVENLMNILGGKGVLEAVAAQGYKIELVEILKEYMRLFPNMFKNPGKIIKQLPPQPQMGGMPGQPVQGTPGQPVNRQMQQTQTPNPANIASEAAGEKGGQIPIA